VNELALFAGAGGGILGGHLLGWRTVCAVEWEPYPASVLIARQNDGILPPFPIWDDVQTFDGRPWRGRVDVVSGGFPCQDISAAGKGAGIDGARSGMWGHMARIVREVGPRFVFVENSPMLTSRGLGRVLGDLAAMGYDARWGVLGAVDAGAPHKRDRIWIVAHSDLHEHRTNGWKEEEQGGISSEHRPARCAWGIGGTSSDSEILADAKNSEWRSGQFGKQNPSVWPQGHDKSFGGGKDVGNAEVPRLAPCVVGSKQEQSRRAGSGITWWEAEPDVGRVANGVAARVDRLKAIGNGQVPACAALAWRILTTSR
jgi:DNA (cytosine-5)-methyltransferase 1